MRCFLTRSLLLLTALLFVGCIPTSDDVSDTQSEDHDHNLDDTGEDESEPYGPDNSWRHADTSEVPAGLSGTGWYAGDTAYNFTLADQHGDAVELYQFYGKLIVLDVFAVWCGPCNDLAPDGEEVWQALKERGVVYLALTEEAIDSSSPTSETAAGWAATHGLTHPVLADSNQEMMEYANIGGGFPTFPVLGPDMTILTNDLYPPTIPDVESLLNQQGL